MLNVTELEKRWFFYKVKYYLPYVLSILIIMIMIVFSLNLKDEKKQIVTEKEKIIHEQFLLENSQTIKKENTDLNNTEKKIDQRSEEKNNESQQINQEKIIIKPSLNFITKIKEESNKNEELKQTDIINQKEEITEITLDNEEKPVEIITSKEENKINIQRQNSNDDIDYVIQRFNKNNNPVLSLFIAKKYYEIQNYKKAYQYAYITNEINGEIEDSWIIFTKSLIKLGEKQKAVDTLNRYIVHSKSSQAKILLEDINTGRFK